MIIPVHDRRRPVSRAIASVRRSVVPARTVLVLHGIDRPPSGTEGDDVTIERIDDGIPSPSGPRNLGLDVATAPWVSFLDSDDELGAGALRSLLKTGRSLGADVAIPRIDVAGTAMRTPLRTGWRPSLMDTEANDLYRRAHAFGIYRLDALREIGARFPPTVRRAEDFAFTAHVWSRLLVAHDPCAVYRLHNDGGARATAATLTPDEEVAFIDAILDSGWFKELTPRRRRLLVRRCLETNLTDAIGRAGGMDAGGTFAEARDRLVAAAPDAAALLSRHAVVRLGIRDGHAARNRFGRAIPAYPVGMVHLSGPVRSTAAGLVLRVVDRLPGRR